MKIRFSFIILLVFILIMSFSSLVWAGEFSFRLSGLTDQPEVFAGGFDEVDRGDDAEFWAMMDAEVLSYQWWSDEGMLSDNHFISGSDSEVLTLKKVSCEDNGNRYWCIITYDGGIACTEKLELKVDHVYDRPSESESAIIQKATCTKRGLCYAACACGAWGDDVLYMDALGHSFSHYIFNEDAECTKDGTETAQCDRCTEKDTRNRAGSARGHDESGDWLCDEESHWKICTVCNDMILLAEHKKGESSKHCSICDRVLETEPEHVHELYEITGKEPTCTEPGQKVCYKCSCNTIFADPEGKTVITDYSELVIPATGHIYDRKEVKETYLHAKADCKNAARYYYSCRCGDKGENIFSYGEKADHCYGSWIHDGNEHYHQCTVCNKITDRNGHRWETMESDHAYKEVYRCACGAEKEVLSHPFHDVSPSNWFYNDVLFVYHEDLIRGLKIDTFGPNIDTSRAMIVTILYRMEGEPKAGNSPFYDVATKSWYGAAVTWAAEHKLVEGYGNGKFGPNDPVTREQIAAILYRYTIYKKGNVSSSVSLHSFPDADDVSSWAQTPMSWAVAEGLISGVGKGNVAYLCPQDNAMRCQISAILNRYLN